MVYPIIIIFSCTSKKYTRYRMDEWINQFKIIYSFQSFLNLDCYKKNIHYVWMSSLAIVAAIVCYIPYATMSCYFFVMACKQVRSEVIGWGTEQMICSDTVIDFLSCYLTWDTNVHANGELGEHQPVSGSNWHQAFQNT